MEFDTQRRLAADILDCSKKRVKFEPSRIEDVREAITKSDIRNLISEGVIQKQPEKGVSRSRARKRKVQKSKGLQSGPGRKKGKKYSKTSRKERWMSKVRAQRSFLKKLRDSEVIPQKTFKDLYNKSKGGFFKSVRHIKLYLKDHDLVEEGSFEEQSDSKPKKAKKKSKKKSKSKSKKSGKMKSKKKDKKSKKKSKKSKSKKKKSKKGKKKDKKKKG